MEIRQNNCRAERSVYKFAQPPYYKPDLFYNSAHWYGVGYHLKISFADGSAKKAQTRGLFIPMTCLYQNRSVTALRLGSATPTFKKMEETMQLLEETYFEDIQNSKLYNLLFKQLKEDGKSNIYRQ